MQTVKTSNYDNMASTGADLLDRTINFIEKVRSSKIVKVAGYAIAAVAGLFALGGILRVLAWTATGWNQFSSVISGK